MNFRLSIIFLLATLFGGLAAIGQAEPPSTIRPVADSSYIAEPHLPQGYADLDNSRDTLQEFTDKRQHDLNSNGPCSVFDEYVGAPALIIAGNGSSHSSRCQYFLCPNSFFLHSPRQLRI